MRNNNYWFEIKADFDELDGLKPKDDIVKCISIDAWKTDDPDEEGLVVAKIILTNGGDSGVIYIDNVARTNEAAQQVIQDILQKIKE